MFKHFLIHGVLWDIKIFVKKLYQLHFGDGYIFSYIKRNV